MEHTPGPWRVGDAGHTVFGPKTDNPSPKIIASRLARGDATLIAEAPNMLDALTALRDSIEDSDQNHEFPYALARATEAIEAATS